MSGEILALPPEHTVPPGVDGETIYITSVRRGLGIEDDDQGRAVIDKLRPHWDAATELGARVLVLEVYFGTALAWDEANNLGATFLQLIKPDGDFDRFLAVADNGYKALMHDREQRNT